MILVIGVQVTASAQQYVQVYDVNRKQSLIPDYQVMWEQQGRLSIEQVLRAPQDFVALADNNPNFGLSERAIWLKVNIENRSVSQDFIITANFAQLDNIDFYTVIEGEVTQRDFQGKTAEGKVFRFPTSNIQIPVGEPLTLYIRAQSQSSAIIVPAYIQSKEVFNRTLQIDSIAWGLFYGGLLILAIYNLSLYPRAKQLSLLAFVGYIITAIIWQFNMGGHVNLLFIEGQPSWLAAHTELSFALFITSCGLFTLSLFDAKKYASRMFITVLGLTVLQPLASIVFISDILPASVNYVLLYTLGCVAIVSYIGAGCEAFFRRFRPAIFFVLAWVLLIIGAFSAMLTLFGVIPSIQISEYYFQAALFLQVGLFSFALTEKTHDQLHTEIEHATNDLRNNMEVIEEQNARLDIARKNAIKASHTKSQFLANMSHEIRTPLNAILGFGKELEQANLEFTENEQVKIVNSAAKNLLTIVNDVLDFSKIEAGKLKVNNSPFSPLGVFEEMVAIMAKTAHSKDLDFIFDSSPLPDKLISDEIRLKQVLTNLIGNALKFTPKGKVSLSVSARQRQHGVIDLKFEVADTGIGISREDRQKLFSAFSQVDDAINRNYQGTGLGLVISQELVRLMNGSIELHSEPGHGTRFSVLVRASHISQRESFSYPNKVTDISVVVFDPLPESRKATAKMLIALGAKVTSVDSLEYLQNIEYEPDFLMIFLPNQSRYSEATIMHCALTVNARNRVVWYCKQDPLQSRPLFKQGFTTSLSMPSTPSRLAQLVAIDSMPILKRPSRTVPVVSANRKALDLPKLTILAVDDIAMNLSLLDTWFKHTSVSVTKALSAEQAILACHNVEYDLILMDVQMPIMDGVDATKEIRKIELNRGTPIIAVTAHAFKEEQDRLLSNGMDDYLAKPIDYDALIEMLGRWCSAPNEDNNEDNREDESALNWTLAMTRANQDEDITKHMIKEFLDFIPSAQESIKEAVQNADFAMLSQEVHKLHGACCYTGAPVIQELSKKIEVHLKRNNSNQALQLIPDLYDALSAFETESLSLLASA